MAKIGYLNPSKCIIFCCDCQEGYRSKIKDFEFYINTAQMMIRTASVFQIPILVTEENPDQNGKLAVELEKYIHKNNSKIYQKYSFSMINDQTKIFLKAYYNCKYTSDTPPLPTPQPKIFIRNYSNSFRIRIAY